MRRIICIGDATTTAAQVAALHNLDTTRRDVFVVNTQYIAEALRPVTEDDTVLEPRADGAYADLSRAAVCGTCVHWSQRELRDVRPRRLCNLNATLLGAFKLYNETCQQYRTK